MMQKTKQTLILTLFAVLALSTAAVAQYRSLPVPDVVINDNAVTYQRSLYPEHYTQASASRDLRWVRAHDSSLTAFWSDNGNLILSSLTELAGIDWVEPRIELYLLRYFPEIGGPDPLVIPLGGMRRGHLTQAAPTGNQMKLNLIYQLSHRMLAQAEKADDPFMRSMTGHPLMQPTLFRRDNLAMLLALVCAQRVIGLDSTYDAYQSFFWKEHHPGREILEQYLLSEWILSSDRTLAQWVIEEPYSSRLVVATRPPRRVRPGADSGPRQAIEGLPLKGRLGFSVIWNASGRLQVDQIDVARLAYASGLVEGDVVRSVDGVRVRNQRDMVERILAGLDEGGATVSVDRDGQTESVIMQPMAWLYDEEMYWEDYDSLYFESLPDSAYLEEPMIDSATTEPDDVDTGGRGPN